MSIIIDGQIIKKAITNAANNLANKQQMINDLNVFPVPDGDTGTNMGMTISAAARELLAKDDTSAEVIADAVAYASLRGARGNSGVILSQLFRGFSKGVSGKSTLSIIDVANAFKNASDIAYKAVMKPTEGTILTVAREAAECAVAIAPESKDVVEFAQKVLDSANASLKRTPELLPVLKQAGVVDAGGMGLVTILEGVVSALKGETIEITAKSFDVAQAITRSDIDTANIKYIYCTEFIITKKSINYSITSFRASIEGKGDSMLVIEDNDIVKVHIHTNHPGYVLEQAVKIGELSSLKIDNMKIQHNEIIETPAENTEPEKPYGFIAVAAGEGLEQIFKDIGTDYIVSGGQSMNPSTEDILEVVNKVNAATIFILPNNKNIILAAEQAAELSEKNIVVLPTKSIPQGISAILAFDESAELSDNEEAMIQAIENVKTASVTFAARDSSFDGMDIKEGDIMGMNEGKITFLGTDPEEVAKQLIASIVDDDSGVISVFYGQDVNEEKIPALTQQITDANPNCDIVVHCGGQPLYYYIISVE